MVSERMFKNLFLANPFYSGKQDILKYQKCFQKLILLHYLNLNNLDILFSKLDSQVGGPVTTIL